MAHKKDRRLCLGEHAALYFEDRLTVQYQIQEMLRAARIFESAGIAEELAVYNPLIPDGSNWKATFMLEYEDVDERQRRLAELIGVEHRLWMRVPGFEQVWAVADEDLDRSRDEKTAAVHFLRFQLQPQMVRAAKDGAEIGAGIDHDAYRFTLEPVPSAARDALVADLG